MKLIITGANGFLGQHLSIYMHNKAYEVFAVSRGLNRIPNPEIHYYSVDLTDQQAVFSLFEQIKPDLVIHTAAMSKPDECHLNRADCLLHNVTATQWLVEAAKNVSARFFYISTDFIFGEGGPHSETAQVEPLNFYGESKWMAEELVRNSDLAHNIIRPVFIYGAHWEGMRPSFIQWVSQNLQKKQPIKVVTDQLRTPTFVLDICKGIELLIPLDTNEDFHFAGSEILSPYQMACSVARLLCLDAALIEPVTADTFPEMVRRAKDSGLRIEKAVKMLGYAPHTFEEAVRLSFGISD